MTGLPENFGDPGFTPGARHFPALIAELSADDEARADAAARALVRGGLAAGRACAERISEAEAPLRGRLVRVMGRIAHETGDEELRAALLARLEDADPKARRNAIIALGKIRGPGVEAALLARWPSATLPERRSLAEALGKVGSAESAELLAHAESDDPELERLRRRALVMLERTATRGTAEIVSDAPLPDEAAVVLRCRAGLAPIVLDEARELGLPEPQLTDATELVLRHAGPLAPLAELRTVLELGIELALAPGGSLVERVVETLASERALAVLGAWSRGAPRFRLAWVAGGHHRADTWRIAETLAARQSHLVNDPTAAAWEIEIDAARQRLVLIPRAVADTRFAYRKRDVAAASHPTLAAALARVAGARPDDIVWDPFVGSGLELVERARLGPFRRLVGSDLDPRALAAARTNLAAAGLRATLEQADARSFDPGPVSLVITNPPMGRRVARDGSLVPLIDAFVDHVANVLAKQGRLVWLSPFGARTARRFEQRGLSVERRGPVDLGGFDAELQIAGPRRRR